MSSKALVNTQSRKAQGIINPMQKRLYTLKEAAEYLGRSEWGMRELVWSGFIPVVKQRNARKIFLDINDLDMFVESNKAAYR